MQTTADDLDDYAPPDTYGFVAAAKRKAAELAAARAGVNPDEGPDSYGASVGKALRAARQREADAAALFAANRPAELTAAEREEFAPPDSWGLIAAAKAKKAGGAA